jgi:ABC-type glycerol-3-phosphate transport system substrate-binding protein
MAPVVAALAAPAAGCALPGLPGTTRETVTVALPTGLPPFDDPSEAIERAAALLNSASGTPYTLKTIRFRGPQRAGEYVRTIAPLLAAAEPADAVLVVSRTNDVATPAGEVQDLVSSKLVAPLDEHAKNDKTYQPGAYYPAALDALRHKGEAYARPLAVEPLVLHYDADLFTAAGLRPPDTTWNWQALRESGRRLTREAPGGFVDQWGLITEAPHWLLLLLIWQNGGDVTASDGKTCTLAEPAAVEALQYLWELVSVHRAAMPPPLPGRPNDYALRFQDQKLYAGPARAAMAVGPGVVDIRQAMLDLGLSDGGLDLRAAEPPQGRQRATGLRVTSALAMTPKARSRSLTYQALSALEREAHQSIPLAARKGSADRLRQLAPGLTAAGAAAIAGALAYARVPRLQNMLAAPQLIPALWQRAIAGVFATNLTPLEAATAAAREYQAHLDR